MVEVPAQINPDTIENQRVFGGVSFCVMEIKKWLDEGRIAAALNCKPPIQFKTELGFA